MSEPQRESAAASRPTPAQERWLAAGQELRGAVPADAIRIRAGGWRTTGLLARVALFALGSVAALLIALLCHTPVGFAGSALPIVVGGLLAVVAGEWLARAQRLHASGIEEGLIATGAVLAALAVLVDGDAGHYWQPVLAVALGVAGLRLLNPLLTTLAVGLAIGWLAADVLAVPLDARLGVGTTALLLAAGVAVLALAAGARRFERPAHDRMLDWLVVALPPAFYVASPAWLAGTGGALPSAAAGPVIAAPLLLGLAAAFLATAWRRRTAAPLRGALAGLACAAVELQRLLQLDPAWWAIGTGIAVLVAAVAVDRWLRVPRAGVTSVRLDAREDPLDLLQAAGASVLAQGAATNDARAPAGSGGDFGGGRYGGGGASGGY
ncbi:MAG: hypothetical protein O9284_02455 [Steroidobacteraceae bacterium]|nr:hypothetical protein [Steroidobacteraceae bacterium]